MPPAVRLSDKANCSADAHGCPACPHPTVGPAVNGSPDVFVNKLPAIRLGDPGIHMACCGTNQWKVAKGSSTVYVNGKPLARMGDKTTHCGGSGSLINGSSNVFADDGAGGAGGLSGLAAAALAAGKALLDQWSAEEKKISGSWAGKDAKGGGGKGKSGSGKDAKGKSGGRKSSKGGGGGGRNAGGADGDSAAGGAPAEGADGDLSSEADAAAVARSGVGLIQIRAAKTQARPDTKLPFTVECRSATTGSVVVGLVLTDGDGQEQVLKKTSVEARLDAAGSLRLPKITWADFARKHKLSPEAVSCKVKLRAEHPSGPPVSSAEIELSDTAQDDRIVLWLHEESADDGAPGDEPNEAPPRKLVTGSVAAKVKIARRSAPVPVVFEDGRAEISGIELPELPEGVGAGDPDPRVEKVTFDDEKYRKHESKAYVGANDGSAGGGAGRNKNQA
jgi:uncharacterized Zn-binding protein involved in type VI secretion